MLGVDPAPGRDRFYRRTLADLAGDVYVAEAADGAIVGLVSLVYPRSLVHGDRAAVLDGARARRDAGRPVLEGLVAFAEDRARRRGCRRLCAWLDRDDAALRETLVARGYRPGEVLTTDLGRGGPTAAPEAAGA
jgi:hypothetical protein